MKNTLKKALFLVCALAALSVLSAFSVFSVEYSADAVLTGDCGEESYVYWEVVPNSDGTTESPRYSMNIFGTGKAFKSLTSSTSSSTEETDEKTISDYMALITRVYIGDNITSIGGSAFKSYSSIHTVELGVNVSTLGSSAFEYCTNLKTIYRKGNEPAVGTFDLTGLTSFGSYLFDGCKYVENIILPTEGSYTLGIEFLKANTMLTTIYIPKACTSINAVAFRNCSALETIYIEGNTLVNEGMVTKGGDGTFYGYAFHNCGVKVDGVKTISISALEGSSAHEYALKNASHSITTVTTTTDSETGETTETSTTVDYAINFIEPYKISIMEDGEELIVKQAVYGFYYDRELNIGDISYILFGDSDYTTLIDDEKIYENKTAYAKKLFNFVGYMVRIEDHHGLRAIYEYNTNIFDSLEGYSVVEAGILGTDLYGVEPILDIENTDANKTVIYKGKTLMGKLLAIPQNGIASFANTAVGYEIDGTPSATRIAKKIISRAYVTLKNETTGDTHTYYSVQSEKDLDTACEATKAAANGKLDSTAIAFIDDLLAIGADPDYIYTKEEAMALLTSVYNDPSHLLSGQHIGYGKYTVRNSLEKIYKATGEMPAVLSYDTSVAYRSNGYGEEYNTVIANDFAEFAKQGGLISMCAHMTNPDPNEPTEDGVYRGKLSTLEQWDMLFEEGNIINENFMAELSATADFLQMLEDRGVTVFWRPMHETNGAWFWFCGASVPTAGKADDVSVEYCKKLWTFIYDYLENERKLDNLIWVYSPNIAKDGNNSGTFDVMKYYPGDDYVDVTGIDVYHEADTLAGDTPTLMQDAYAENWSRLAGKYTGTELYNPMGKQVPVVYGEFGPGSKLRNADPELSYNGENALDFVKKVEASGRHMGWIVFWSGWTDNWLSLDTMYKADVFMKSDFILDLNEARTLMLNMHYGE